jgi:hypothetical protein
MWTVGRMHRHICLYCRSDRAGTVDEDSEPCSSCVGSVRGSLTFELAPRAPKLLHLRRTAHSPHENTRTCAHAHRQAHTCASKLVIRSTLACASLQRAYKTRSRLIAVGFFSAPPRYSRQVTIRTAYRCRCSRRARRATFTSLAHTTSAHSAFRSVSPVKCRDIEPTKLSKK